LERTEEECAQDEVLCREKEAGAKKWLPAEGRLQGEVAIEAEVPTQGGVGKRARRAARAARKLAGVVECCPGGGVLPGEEGRG
jgi:hypothetical protein